VRAVRGFLRTFSLLVVATAIAEGQEQEGKMMDRMMRPNMELSNPAQDKKFTAVEGVSVDKKFEAKEFYSGHEPVTKSFFGARSFFSKAFGTGKYARAKAAANYRKNADLAFASTQFQSKKSEIVKESSFAKKKSATRDYAESKPFLAEGTRQKQLSEQSHAMTIDEVRDLLNKGR
jgi:hypothetical protein